MADPGRTYAVVVGVDQYDLPGDAWALPQARVAALDFALWLREKKVPAENIFLVTGGQHRDLPAQLEDSTLHYPKADVIRGLLANRLSERSGDLLIVFWSGHGELSGHDDRLLLSNATNNCRAIIRTRDLHNALASVPLRSFSRKVLIVDACRAPGGPSAFPDTFDLGGFSKPRASLIQSAEQGEKGRAGAFASPFIDALRKSEWPPDFEAIAHQLKAEVEKGEVLAQAASGPAILPSQPALFCDRTRAAGEFRGRVQIAFESSAPLPILCLAYAESDHRPDSLIDRLIAEVNMMRGTQLREKVVEWNHFDETQIRRELAGRLLDEWNRLPSAADLAQQLAKVKRQPYILVRHNIREWQNGTAATLEAYLDFWRQWPALQAAPPVFVFFAIVQPTQRKWFRLRADPRVPRDLGALSFPDGALVVNDVGLVDKGHLADLIDEYRLASSGTERDALIQEVLGTASARPMADVERQLINIFKRKAS